MPFPIKGIQASERSCIYAGNKSANEICNGNSAPLLFPKKSEAFDTCMPSRSFHRQELVHSSANSIHSGLATRLPTQQHHSPSVASTRQHRRITNMNFHNKSIMDSPLESQSADSNMAVGATTTVSTILDTAVDNSKSGTQEAPAEPKLKGFMRLPAEIRLQIYEDLFTPPPGIITSCHPAEQTRRLFPAKVSTDLANTTPLTAISSRRT